LPVLRLCAVAAKRKSAALSLVSRGNPPVVRMSRKSVVSPVPVGTMGKPAPSRKRAGDCVKPKASSRVAALCPVTLVVVKSATPEPSGTSKLHVAFGVVPRKGVGLGTGAGPAG
jgi:hypothetical protein